MDKFRTKETDELFRAMMTLDGIDEYYAFFEDICTVNEIISLSQRLQVARLLSEKKNYQEISKQTGASTATIGRVSKCLSYGSDGYKIVLERLGKKD